MIAVLGTPCSGTGYVTALLRRHGLDVGHEHLLRDGIVCGFAALGQRRPGRRPERVRPIYDPRDFDVTVRLIRDPLEVAQSLPWVMGMTSHELGDAARGLKASPEVKAHLRTEFVPPADWRMGHPVRKPERAPEAHGAQWVRLALRFWVLAHEAIPDKAPVMRLASVDRDFAERVAPLLGLAPRRVGPIQSPVKPRRWERAAGLPHETWDEWAKADPAFAARGRALWDRYGTPDARETTVPDSPERGARR